MYRFELSLNFFFFLVVVIRVWFGVDRAINKLMDSSSLE